MQADCPRCRATVRFRYEEAAGFLACPECDTLFHPLTGEVMGADTDEVPSSAVPAKPARAEPPPPPRRATKFRLRGAVEVPFPEEDASSPKVEYRDPEEDRVRLPSRKEWLPFWGCVAGLWVVVALYAWWSIDSHRQKVRQMVGGLAPLNLGGGLGGIDSLLHEQVEGSYTKIILAQCGGFLAYSTWLMYWLARDAKARALRPWPYLPLLVPLTLGVFVVFYFIFRPPGHLAACPRCAGQRLAFAESCPHCGTLLQ